MKIAIDEINSASERSIGFSQLPSFIVQFRAYAFRGAARFVPANGLPDACKGFEFNVEIAQESVSQLCILQLGSRAAIEPIGEDGSYKVCGVVSAVMTPTEPVGSRITVVAAEDAIFTLTLDDLGDLRPDIGNSVSFIVHGMSLWDEAI